MVSEPQDKKFRIIYMPIFEPGFPVLKKQKRGLREALARIGTVIEIDWWNEFNRTGHARLLEKISKTATDLQPNLVICQFHDAKKINRSDIQKLRQFARDAVWVNWNGDYQDFRILRQEDIDLASAFDLQLVVSYDGAEEYNKRGIKSHYWQIGWEPDGVGYEPTWFTPHHEVLFLANPISWYPTRRTLVETLRKGKVKLGLYGIRWPLFWARGSCYWDFKKGCRLIRAAKLVLADNPRPNARGYVSNRLFQSTAAGSALVLLQYFHEYQTLGFIDGQHLVVWNKIDDLLEKIEFWLRHENEDCRRALVVAGQNFCLQRHSFDVRVQELIQMLKEFD